MSRLVGRFKKLKMTLPDHQATSMQVFGLAELDMRPIPKLFRQFRAKQLGWSFAPRAVHRQYLLSLCYTSLPFQSKYRTRPSADLTSSLSGATQLTQCRQNSWGDCGVTRATDWEHLRSQELPGEYYDQSHTRTIFETGDNVMPRTSHLKWERPSRKLDLPQHNINQAHML